MNVHLFLVVMGSLLFVQNLGHSQAFLLAFAHFFFRLLHSLSIYLHGSLHCSLLKCHIIEKLLPGLIKIATPFPDIHSSLHSLLFLHITFIIKKKNYLFSFELECKARQEHKGKERTLNCFNSYNTSNT